MEGHLCHLPGFLAVGTMFTGMSKKKQWHLRVPLQQIVVVALGRVWGRWWNCLRRNWDFYSENWTVTYPGRDNMMWKGLTMIYWSPWAERRFRIIVWVNVFGLSSRKLFLLYVGLPTKSARWTDSSWVYTMNRWKGKVGPLGSNELWNHFSCKVKLDHKTSSVQYPHRLR